MNHGFQPKNEDERPLDSLLDISIIIPCIEEFEQLARLIQRILDNNEIPKELIVIYSGQESHKNVEKQKRLKETYEAKGGIMRLINLGPKIQLPGEARNRGIEAAKTELVGFLDIKTAPEENWPSESIELIKNKDFDIVLGSTLFKAESKFQQLAIDCTFGRKPITTLPGTIARKKVFNIVGMFLPNTRAGEDTDWMLRARCFENKMCTIYPSRKRTTTYTGIPRNLKTLCLKWFRNYYQCCSIVHHLAVQRLYYAATAGIAILLLAFRWNATIAGWDPDHILYINSITKMTLALVVLSYGTLRGLIIPHKKGVKIRDLLPARFIIISTISGLLDCVKLAAYTLGAITKPTRR